MHGVGVLVVSISPAAQLWRVGPRPPSPAETPSRRPSSSAYSTQKKPHKSVPSGLNSVSVVGTYVSRSDQFSLAHEAIPSLPKHSVVVYPERNAVVLVVHAAVCQVPEDL